MMRIVLVPETLDYPDDADSVGPWNCGF